MSPARRGCAEEVSKCDSLRRHLPSIPASGLVPRLESGNLRECDSGAGPVRAVSGGGSCHARSATVSRALGLPRARPHPGPRLLDRRGRKPNEPTRGLRPWSPGGKDVRTQGVSVRATRKPAK